MHMLASALMLMMSAIPVQSPSGMSLGQVSPHNPLIELRSDRGSNVLAFTTPARGWHCYASRQPWGVVNAGCFKGKSTVSLSGFTPSGPVQASSWSTGKAQVMELRYPEGWSAHPGPSSLPGTNVRISRDRK